MKKLFFVFAFLAFACASDDDNNNEETSFVLVGTWAGYITESEDDIGSEFEVELVLNSDSTGALAIPDLNLDYQPFLGHQRILKLI